MKTVRLGEITNNLDKKRIPLNSAQRLEKSEHKIYPYIGANNILTYIDEYIFDEEILCVAEDGGSWGAGEVCSNIYNEKCWVNNHAHVLTANAGTYLDYLRHYLNYSNLNSYITGATRGKLTRKYLDLIKISIPHNFNDQIRIATLLSRIEALITIRKENLQLLDQFLKSTFLEMFGDNLSSKEQHESLGSKIDILTDYHANGSYKVLKENVNIKHEKSYALMVRTTDLENNEFDKNCIYIDKKAYKYLKKSVVYGGEIIINKIGSAGKVYLMPILNRPVTLGMNCFLLRFNNTVNVSYIYSLLKSDYGDRLIQGRVKGAVTKTITKDAIRKLQFPFPEIELQNKFSDIVKKVESIKALYQQNLNNLENLYGSLSQKAFKGDLDLSQIPLPDNEPKEETIKETPPVYTKSAPDIHKTELTYLKNNIKEQQLLCSLFNKYLNSYKDKTFTLDDYFFYWSHSENTHNKTFGLADYELIKKWLYQLINNGTIKQVIDNEKNQLVLKLNG